MNHAAGNSLSAPSDNATPHHSTVELANCKLELRADLCFHLQEYRGIPCYLIEDEFNSRFFRIGIAEYRFICSLDGSTTIAQATAKNASHGEDALGEKEATNVCKWLIDNGLASTGASRSSNRLMEASSKSDKRKTVARLNPVSQKFLLFNPNRFLTQICPMSGWIFSLPMFLVWCGVVLGAIFQIVTHWDEACGSQSRVFARNNWVWLGLSWLLLKLIHETAHGLACKRLGGDVRQCGIVLIMMLPLPFVDVTSSWRFPSKWLRILVAAAGMYVELFVAAMAAIVWSLADDGLIRQHAYNFMLAGSITTLLFNANPLMRFDGYYMLSDWLELPNLGTHGQQWLKWVGKKFYLGMDEKRPSWPEGRGWIVACYAILALIWKVIICIGLTIAAESLLFGAGVALTMGAVLFWVVWPLAKLIRLVFIGQRHQQRPGRLRFCILTLAVGATLWTLATQTPWYSRVEAPAIVDYQHRIEVRTPVAGFLADLFVSQGQIVKRGHVLARLENVELDAEIQQLKVQLESSNLRMRQFRQQASMAAYDAELENRTALAQRLTERQSQQRRLLIVANADGVVNADDLDSKQGRFFSPGSKICNIESDEHKEVHALVAQHDFDLFQQRMGKSVNVHVWGSGPGHFPARLSDLNSRARLEIPHPALGANAGGPLPVRNRIDLDGEPQSNQSQLELVNPRFLARVQLPASASLQFKCGQPAMISFRTTRGSIGEVLWESFSQWIRTIKKRSQTASLR